MDEGEVTQGGAHPMIDPRFYTAALEEELGRVTNERILLRAALNQQAETLAALAAERDRWRELAEAADGLNGDGPDANGSPGGSSAA